MTPLGTPDAAPSQPPPPRGIGVFGTVVRCTGGPAAIFFGMLGMLAFGGNVPFFLLSVALVIAGVACLLDYWLRLRTIGYDSPEPPEGSDMGAVRGRRRRDDLERIVVILSVVALIGMLAFLVISATLLSPYPHGASVPSVGFTSSGSASNGADTINYDNFTLGGSSALTTSEFGLNIITSSGTSVTKAPVPSACAPGAAIGTCGPVVGGWYAVLANTSTGRVVGAFGAGGWTVSAMAISSWQTLVLLTAGGISGLTLAGSVDTLYAVGTGGFQVSGQTTL